MVFRFYKNNSDNRKLNKDLTPLVVGTNHTLIIDDDFIPRATCPSDKITCSSENSNYPAWGAFNATTNNSWNSPEFPPTYDTCWLPDSTDNSPYIQIELNEIRPITEVSFICGSDYADNFTCNMIISGSLDGIAFDTIYSSTITAILNTGTLMRFTVNETEYKYIRISFDRSLANPYNPSMFISGINANSYHYEDVPTYDMNVIFKTDETKDTPTLELAYNENLFENANYCYCVDTGYYFYLSEPTMSAQRLFFSANTDLLNTYKNDILNLGCILARQENKFNAYLKDSEQAILSKRVVDTRLAPHGFNNNDCFILATCGK